MKMQLKPINNNILFERMYPMREGLIHLPDSIKQKSFFAIIHDTGEKVKDSYLVKDRIVFLNPYCMRIKFDETKRFIAKESDIVAVMQEGVLRPFGNRVLMRRLNQERVSSGGIIIPDCHESADQTLEGILVGYGVVNGNIIDFPVPVGDHVKIEKWSPNLIEIDVNGEYDLTVPVKELQYAKSFS